MTNPESSPPPEPSNQADPADTRTVEQAPAEDQLGIAEEVGEEILLDVRPSMFYAHPFRYIGLVLLSLAGLVLAIVAPLSAAVPQWLVWPAITIMLVCAITWSVWWFNTHLSIALTVTNKRAILRRGFLSRATSEVLHSHIRNIRVDQSFLQRIFGVGRLRIDTAAGGGGNVVEIDMKDVPRPNEIKELIDPYRDWS